MCLICMIKSAILDRTANGNILELGGLSEESDYA